MSDLQKGIPTCATYMNHQIADHIINIIVVIHYQLGSALSPGRRNISSIRWVITNPPKMLIAAMRVQKMATMATVVILALTISIPPNTHGHNHKKKYAEENT